MSNARYIVFFAVAVLAACSGARTYVPQSPPDVQTLPDSQRFGDTRNKIKDFTEFALPAGQTGGESVTLDWQGNAWVLTQLAIDRVSLTGQVEAFAAPAGVLSFDGGTAFGPDGSLWLLGNVLNAPNFPPANENVFRLTQTGRFSAFPIPTSAFISVMGNEQGEDVAVGPGSTIWFTAPEVGAAAACGPVGSITTGGVFRAVTAQCGGPEAITQGPDGNMWIALGSLDPLAVPRVARFSRQAAIVDAFSFPLKSDPAGIASGPDGNLWITAVGLNAIVRMTTSGAMTRFPLRTPNALGFGGVAQNDRIVNGGDGTMWFVENQANKIGRITMSGRITEYLIPTPNSSPSGLAVTPPHRSVPGRVWFVESATNKLATFTFRGR